MLIEKNDKLNQYVINNKSVFFYCNPELKPIADFFFNILIEEEKAADVLKANCIIQIGWGLYHVIEINEGLQIVACDIEKNPFENTNDDISTLLKIFQRQCEIIQETGASPVETTLKNTMIIQKSALKQSMVFMQRQTPSSEQDSGWYLGAMDNTASNALSDYAKVYTYQLFGFCQEALGIMQLPIGTIAAFDNGRLIEIVDSNNRKIW